MKNTLLATALFLGFSVTGFSQTTDVTGEIFLDDGREMIIENPNVTVVPGEELIIHSNGTDRSIVVNKSGQVIGEIRGIKAETGIGGIAIKVRAYKYDLTGFSDEELKAN